MARAVIWSDEAIADLAVIVSYVAQDNRNAAESLGRTILERTRMLADFKVPMQPKMKFNTPSKGAVLAAKYRARANAISAEKRQRHRAHAMSLIYGNPKG